MLPSVGAVIHRRQIQAWGTVELLLLLLLLLRPEPESLLAGALFELAKKANATGDLPELEQPGRNVFLGEQYVNNPTLSDVTFLVQVRFT